MWRWENRELLLLLWPPERHQEHKNTCRSTDMWALFLLVTLWSHHAIMTIGIWVKPSVCYNFWKRRTSPSTFAFSLLFHLLLRAPDVFRHRPLSAAMLPLLVEPKDLPSASGRRPLSAATSCRVQRAEWLPPPIGWDRSVGPAGSLSSDGHGTPCGCPGPCQPNITRFKPTAKTGGTAGIWGNEDQKHTKRYNQATAKATKQNNKQHLFLNSSFFFSLESSTSFTHTHTHNHPHYCLIVAVQCQGISKQTQRQDARKVVPTCWRWQTCCWQWRGTAWFARPGAGPPGPWTSMGVCAHTTRPQVSRGRSN